MHKVGGGSDHQIITVNACGNAAGTTLPPFIKVIIYNTQMVVPLELAME